MAVQLVGEQLALAYRDLIGAEARLGEALSRRGIRIGATLADQWSTLHDFLNLYARSLSPAGMLVLAGRPDEGSRATGIPFTDAPRARDRLDLPARGESPSPGGGAFWRAVDAARAAAQDAPVEALFGTMQLAHAQPFDFPPEPEVREESAAHVLRLLSVARPQAVLCVGPEALATLGRALHQPDLVELAAAREAAWLERWPVGTRLSAYPYAEVAARTPFRVRVVPVPALTGARAAEAERVLAAAFAYALA